MPSSIQERGHYDNRDNSDVHVDDDDDDDDDSNYKKKSTIQSAHLMLAMRVMTLIAAKSYCLSLSEKFKQFRLLRFR